MLCFKDFSRITNFGIMYLVHVRPNCNDPRKRHLDPRDVNEIKFVKLEHGKSKRSSHVVPYDPRPTSFWGTSDEEIQGQISHETQGHCSSSCYNDKNSHHYQAHHHLIHHLYWHCSLQYKLHRFRGLHRCEWDIKLVCWIKLVSLNDIVTAEGF